MHDDGLQLLNYSNLFLPASQIKVSLLSDYEVIDYVQRHGFNETLPPKRNRWSRSDQGSNDCLGSSTKTPNCRPIMFAHNRATLENEFSKTAILAD